MVKVMFVLVPKSQARSQSNSNVDLQIKTSKIHLQTQLKISNERCHSGRKSIQPSIV
jgi:hypothetical protein